MQDEIDKLQVMIHGLIAAIGGFVRVLAENRKYTWYYYASQAIISSFAGVIVGLLLNDVVTNVHWLLSIAGLAGYAGSGILHILSEKLKKFIEKKPL